MVLRGSWPNSAKDKPNSVTYRQSVKPMDVRSIATGRFFRGFEDD